MKIINNEISNDFILKLNHYMIDDPDPLGFPEKALQLLKEDPIHRAHESEITEDLILIIRIKEKDNNITSLELPFSGALPKVVM